jgi:hypothetical protein
VADGFWECGDQTFVASQGLFGQYLFDCGVGAILNYQLHWQLAKLIERETQDRFWCTQARYSSAEGL